MLRHAYMQLPTCRCGHHWFQCNDARIALVDERSVRNSEAYMLFYRQKPSHPLQGQSILQP